MSESICKMAGLEAARLRYGVRLEAVDLARVKHMPNRLVSLVVCVVFGVPRLNSSAASPARPVLGATSVPLAPGRRRKPSERPNDRARLCNASVADPRSRHYLKRKDKSSVSLHHLCATPSLAARHQLHILSSSAHFPDSYPTVSSPQLALLKKPSMQITVSDLAVQGTCSSSPQLEQNRKFHSSPAGSSSSLSSSPTSDLPHTPMNEILTLNMPKEHQQHQQHGQQSQPALLRPLQQTSLPPTPPSDDDQLFQQWRPSSHLLAPHGWMNDPCGPSYDPRTGMYHMWYQWNPKGSTWGNMSWGHATSTNLVHWKSSTHATIEPGTNHDHEGVFTGCVLHRSPLGEPEEAAESDQMTAIYTAVSRLPIHHTLPYNYGAEKVVLSTSSDGGQSWTPHGVIVPGPPTDVEVISWRDPYISAWPLLDKLLHRPQPGLYALIAGGIKDKTPTIFAYSVDPSDLSSWSYIGTLCDVGRNRRLTPEGVDLGKNWEVANFFSLLSCASQGPQQEHEYLLINVEGCEQPGPARAAIWAKIDASAKADAHGEHTVRLEPTQVGLLDYGCLYAASSFHDEVANRRIMWGWITEDDLPESYYDTQGWSGMLSLPRVLFHHPDSEHIGTRPAGEVKLLRNGALHLPVSRAEARKLVSPDSAVVAEDGERFATASVAGVSKRSLEIETELDAGLVGVAVAHSADLGTRTLVYVNTEGELVVDRTRSSGRQLVQAKGLDVNTSTLRAKIPAQHSKTASSSNPTHHLRLFLDNSVLEIFVDDLLALSTRIYPDDADTGLSLLFADTTRPTSQTDATVNVWHGLANAHVGFL
ncbi:Arabinanase/levansucrase/invertase [Testicularia cyperi]|uniref:Arabinanase/levansucrase/invertase n=1 Tax=Testicularia cyperi TaxID=1882483 RepID=A0A317XJB4_9BASI|nr:Arabinanase/levansucrase/invertase [Testicularia cyperi]